MKPFNEIFSMQQSNTLKTVLLLAALLPLVACNSLTGDSAQATEAGKQSQRQENEAGGGHADHEESGEKHAENESGGGHDDEGGEHEGEGERKIHLSKTQRERLDIKVAKAKSGSASAMIQAPATVQFDSDRVARVGPRLEAKVIKVSKDLGQKVKAGDTLAVLDSVELGRAKSRYSIADANLQAAQAEYQRDRSLVEQQIISEDHLLRSKTAYLAAKAERDAVRAELRLYGVSDAQVRGISVSGKQLLSRYHLTAPIDGTLQRRDLVPGQTISAQETPIHVVDSARMWVFIEAYEQDLARLQPGLLVSLTVRALPGETFEGKTDWVSNELDEQARTVRVRATVPNPDGKLRAGMFGTARIQAKSEAHYALVPIDAVQTIEREEVVFIPGDEANAFEAVAVTTGSEGDGQIEIRKGLMPGDAVVTVGAFDLNSALTAGSRSAAHNH